MSDSFLWNNSKLVPPPEGELVLVSWTPGEFESDTCVDGRWQQYNTLVSEAPCFWFYLKTPSPEDYDQLL